MKRLFILFLLCFQGLSNANLTLNTFGVPICLTIDGLDDEICNNETLSIEGTDDHMLYFVYEAPLTDYDGVNTDFPSIITFLVDNVFNFLLAVIGIFAVMGVIALLVSLILRFIGVK